MFGNKKLCWEFLDELSLTKAGCGSDGGRFVTRSNGPYRLVEAYWEYKESCNWCGEPYFARYTNSSPFCSIECKRSYKKSLPTQPKPKVKKSPRAKNPEQVHKNRSDAAKKLWKDPGMREKWLNAKQRSKGRTISNEPLYDYYHKKIEIYKSTKSNDGVLELQCDICSKWYTPKATTLSEKLNELKKGKKQYFCCSKECIRVASGKRVRKEIKQCTPKGKKVYKELIKFKLPTLLNQHKKEQRKKLLQEKRAAERKLLSTLRKIKKIKVKEEKLQKYGRGITKENNPQAYKARRLLYYSKVRAKQLGVDNNLTFDWIYRNIKQRCAVTGINFTIKNTNRHPLNPSIDRIDNSMGYTKDNCRLVIWGFNSARNSFSDEDVYTVLKKFVDCYK